MLPNHGTDHPTELHTPPNFTQRCGRPLHGAPVAMTPFCRADPNMATKGFRFWESGFWAGALSGKPYHISALFVADLAAFRSIRAAGGVRAPSWASEQGVGDIYRSTYQSLTADPSSLANLDQYLPNYLQGMVIVVDGHRWPRSDCVPHHDCRGWPPMASESLRLIVSLIRCPSTPCPRSGSGVSPGAATPRRPLRRRSTCVTTR